MVEERIIKILFILTPVMAVSSCFQADHSAKEYAIIQGEIRRVLQEGGNSEDNGLLISLIESAAIAAEKTRKGTNRILTGTPHTE